MDRSTDNKDKYYSDLILKGLYKKKIKNFKDRKYSYDDIENFLRKVNCEDLEISKDLINNLSYKLFDLNTFFNLVKNECDKVGNLDNFKIPESFKNINYKKDKLKLLSNKLQNNKDKLDRITSLLKKGENIHVQEGGSTPFPTDGWLTIPGDSTFSKVLDILQIIIDILGFFPVIGDFADIGNGIISLFRGEFVDALLSFLGALPIVGSVIAFPFKFFRKFNKARKARNAIKAFSRAKRVTKAARMARRGQEMKGYYDEAQGYYDDTQGYYGDEQDY